VPGAKLLYDAHEVGFMTFREMLQYVNNLWLAIPSLASTQMWESLFDWIIRHRIDAMITVNEPLADLHAEHYHRPKPEVVMNCPPRFTPTSESRSLLAQRIGVDLQTPIVIYQGMLVRDRHGVGLENLIRCAPLLRRGVVVILGRGAQFEELRSLTAQSEFVGRAFMLPAVPPNELLDYTAGASIGVIPTEFWLPSLRFSSPNKLFEYLAVGLPVVTSDLPVIRAICDKYGCGLICDPRSPASIADALNRLLDDPELYQRMHNGALAAAQVYNWQAQEQVLLDVYRRLLADPASQSAIRNPQSTIP
jgi:glycosyltransferase involved in cell wall biosynthesis